MTHQLEVGQSTLNGFRGIKPGDNFGRYLPEVLTNPNKFIRLWIKNPTYTSPVYRIFSSLNVIFILAILTLSAFGARSWIYPKYPSRVNIENQMDSSRKIEHLKIKRQTFTPQSVNEIVSKNLFRKERTEYIPPAPPQPISEVAKVAPRPTLPPPKLTLRGVMLLKGTKIAILEGSYPVAKENKVEDTPIKRKGYYLGDQIGSYKIAQISKREVILNSSTGQIIAVKLKRSITMPNRKQRKPKFTSTRPVTKKRPQPTPRISGSISPQPIRQHISGR